MSVWSGLGMNFGSKYRDSFDASDCNTQLDILKSVGISKIRLDSISSTSSDTIKNNNKSVLLACIAKGFYTVWGPNAGDSITDAQWSTFITQVEADALYAQQNGVSEFMFGNEEERRLNGSYTGGVSQLRTNIRSEATTLQGIFTRGNITHSVSQGDIAGWNSDANKGGLDNLSLNVYGSSQSDTAGFQSTIQSLITAYTTGGMYISEWNLDATWSSVTYNDEKQTVEIAKRQKIIKDLLVPSAYFYKWHDASDDYSVTYTAGGYKQFWNPLATNNGRRFFLNI